MQEEMKCISKHLFFFFLSCYKQSNRLAHDVNGNIDEINLMYNVSRASCFLGALLAQNYFCSLVSVVILLGDRLLKRGEKI